MATADPHAVDYAEFGEWYDGYRADVLEPALIEASDALDHLVGDLLSERDLTRIRDTVGRVKSKRRTWRKVRQPRYSDRINTVAEIPDVLDDLVGVRITCTNLQDIDMVQAALDNLPRRPGRGAHLWVDPSSERDYVLRPKESGYRGWHVNLGVLVGEARSARSVTCELQVRTLLQDSWGELTHEETYNKDGELPPLVEVLSRRMADLFSTLDDIAEDLRTELERIDEDSLREADDDEPQELAAPTTETGQAADAAAVLFERWSGLDRPTDLASLAWGLQREFGPEISDDWFGQRSFKRFLRHAVPAGEISTGRQAYLLPPDYDPAEGDEVDGPSTGSAGDTPATGPPATDRSGSDRDVPGAARRLRQIDRGFPLLDADQWPPLYTHLAEAWRRIGPRPQSTRALNQLTRSARDRADAAGVAVSRRHLDYVAKSVLAATESGEPRPADEIAVVFTAQTVQRMTDLRILGGRNRKGKAAVKRWLNDG